MPPVGLRRFRPNGPCSSRVHRKQQLQIETNHHLPHDSCVFSRTSLRGMTTFHGPPFSTL